MPNDKGPVAEGSTPRKENERQEKDRPASVLPVDEPPWEDVIIRVRPMYIFTEVDEKSQTLTLKTAGGKLAPDFAKELTTPAGRTYRVTVAEAEIRIPRQFEEMYRRRHDGYPLAALVSCLMPLLSLDYASNNRFLPIRHNFKQPGKNSPAECEPRLCTLAEHAILTRKLRSTLKTAPYNVTPADYVSWLVAEGFELGPEPWVRPLIDWICRDKPKSATGPDADRKRPGRLPLSAGQREQYLEIFRAWTSYKANHSHPTIREFCSTYRLKNGGNPTESYVRKALVWSRKNSPDRHR